MVFLADYSDVKITAVYVCISVLLGNRNAFVELCTRQRHLIVNAKCK